MPRKDIIHEAVKNALVKDGWTITHDPFRIEVGEMDVFADLRVEKVESNEGSSAIRRALVIEIKSFSGLSPAHNLEVALGQYELYRTFLRRVAPTDSVYLAVSETIYKEHFESEVFQFIVQEHHIAIVVVEIINEEVVRWIN